jgi:hypothetical protein
LFHGLLDGLSWHPPSGGSEPARAQPRHPSGATMLPYPQMDWNGGGQSMRLWTIQRADRGEILIQKGRLFALWPSDPAWRTAYRWMAKQLQVRTGSSRLVPPAWSWHSWRAWQRVPDLECWQELLSDAEIAEVSWVEIEFVPPESMVLLSDYDVWTEMLEYFVAERPVPRSCVSQLFIPSARQAVSIQACTAEIRFEWVIDIRPVRFHQNLQ